MSPPSAGIVSDYAARLLTILGAGTSRPQVPASDDALPAQLAWARSGAMTLSGRADGEPILAPAPIASAAQGAIAALRELAGRHWRGGALDAAALLGERAAIFEYSRQGAVAPGGSCRLIETADGWLAVNLARDSDRDLLPAWFETEASGEPWNFVEANLATGKTEKLLARARLLGMPVAPVSRREDQTPESGAWFASAALGNDATERDASRPVVLDLSTLWAGPLCGHLLGLAGARVIKVESLERPDGARAGPAAFYDLMNGDKESVALDFTTAAGRTKLEALIERADIVIESARPRALRQLGIIAEEWVDRRPGLTWLGITGYGRTEPEANWVAFGDDATAAAGLCWAAADMDTWNSDREKTPLFCGDAIADPLTGLHAAVAGLANWRSNKSQLLDVSLYGVVKHVMDLCVPTKVASVETDAEGRCFVRAGQKTEFVATPRARDVVSAARALGADNDAALESLGIGL